MLLPGGAHASTKNFSHSGTTFARLVYEAGFSDDASHKNTFFSASPSPMANTVRSTARTTAPSQKPLTLEVPYGSNYSSIFVFASMSPNRL